MTTTNDTDGLLRTLTQDECWQLLADHTMGRIGYVDRGGPVVLPFNYQVHEGRLYLRTASHNQLAVHLPGQLAAFEIDNADPHGHTGWSVLVRGSVEHVVNSATVVPAPDPESAPWPDGLRTMVFCLTPDLVTGRALQQADVTPRAGRSPGSVQRVGVDTPHPSLES